VRGGGEWRARCGEAETRAPFIGSQLQSDAVAVAGIGIGGGAHAEGGRR
jgi:hypothetical protein